MAPRSTKYVIHDNYGRPFIVDDTKSEKNVVVYRTKDEDERGAKVLRMPYERIFVGDNLLKDKNYAEFGWAKGNSLLLQSSEKRFIYVGDCIFSFEPVEDDIIVKYYSPVGNNDVPYPYAVGKKYVYFMWDKTYYPVELFDLKKDASMQMILHTIKPPPPKDDAEMRKIFAKHSKKIKLKMIQKRLV